MIKGESDTSWACLKLPTPGDEGLLGGHRATQRSHRWRWLRMPPERSQAGGQEGLPTGAPRNQSHRNHSDAPPLRRPRPQTGQAVWSWPCWERGPDSPRPSAPHCEMTNPTSPLGRHVGSWLSAVALELEGQDEPTRAGPGEYAGETASHCQLLGFGKLTWGPLSWRLRFPIRKEEHNLSLLTN